MFVSMIFMWIAIVLLFIVNFALEIRCCLIEDEFKKLKAEFYKFKVKMEGCNENHISTTEIREKTEKRK